MNRRRLLIRAGTVAALGGAAWWAREHLFWPAPDVRFADGAATPWMPWAQRGGLPTVGARIAGRAVNALIDSGAEYSVIDRALFAALAPGRDRRPVFDMPMLAYGVGGGSQVGRGASVDVALPGLAIEGLRAAILDLGDLAADEGLATPLILGQDVLSRVVLALDVPRRHARLIAPAAFVPPPDLKATAARRSGRAVTTEVTVEGAVLRALIDTGSSSLLAVDRATAAAAGLLDGRPAQAGSSLVLGGVVRSGVVEARTLTFADQLYRNVAVGVYDQPPLPNFPGGLVGMAAFEGRRMALDMGAGALSVSRPLDLTIG